MKKIFLLDAFALIYRAHFAFINAPRVNSKGMNTSSTFGFANTVLEILQKEKPTHIAVAFDTEEPTFRHETFNAYKAQRQEQPEDITKNLPFIVRLIEALGIKQISKAGFEADDVIGTLAKKFSNPIQNVYMMTSDKDYCQLVTSNVFVYRPAFMGKGPEVYDVPKVLEKFQINAVQQVTDILGLQGDSVDNIPGIPGIGEKTAIKLIAEYGSIENLIANAHNLSGKLKENVIKYATQGIQSKQLATIVTDVPLDITLDDIEWKGFNNTLLENLLDELEFRQMKSKLIGQSETKKTEKAPKQQQMSLFGEQPQKKDSSDAESKKISFESTYEGKSILTYDHTAKNYHILYTLDEVQAVAKYLSNIPSLCFDTETTSVDSQEAELVGISFSYLADEAYYIPCPADIEQTQKIISLIKPIFENAAIEKIGHNIKYDISVLKRYGVQVSGPLYDTMLAHYLLDPDKRHGMDTLSQTYLQYQPISITSLIGEKGKNQGNMRDANVADVAIYAAEDADVTFQLKHVFDKELVKANLKKLFHEIECQLVYVLEDMERVGVKIDTKALADISGILQTDIEQTEKRIYELAGEQFLVSSPKQLGVILFEKLKLVDKPKKTESGQYATGEEILSKLADEHEIARVILEYREYQKLKSTYVDALPQLINTKTGRVHTTYNQAVAATGRLSSTNPNLQNIPIRTARGKEIRKAFVAENDRYCIVSADYSQIELRIMAAFSQDKTMTEAFKAGLDIHASTASKVFAVPINQVDGDMRRKAKMVNFGIIYGISPFGLAQRLSIPRKEAQDIIQAYWSQFPSVKKYMENIVETARKDGYVTTYLNRRRYLRDINSQNQTLRGFAERNAINAPIQGTAADIIKKAMIDIHQYLVSQNLESKMILQVHDELVFEVYKPELNKIMEVIPKLMTQALPLSVPMEVSLGYGDNWLDAH